MRWLSKITTFVVTVGVLTLIVLGVRAKMPTITIDGPFQTSAKFRDGSKITKGSPVVIAGVAIGRVSNIVIEGRFARMDMRLRSGMQIPASSFITRRSDSLFGDSYLEIIPPLPEPGTPAERLLVANEPIIHVIEGSTTDAVLRGIDQNLPRIDHSLEVMHELMTNGRKAVSGETAERIDEIDRWIAAGNIESPLHATQRSMARLDEMTTRGASAIATLPREIDAKLTTIENGLARARTGMADGKVALQASLSNARDGLDGADEQIEAATQVVRAINEGEGKDWKGTLGRLVNDERLANDIEDATESLRESVGNINRFKSWLGMRFEWNVFSGQSRFYAVAEIRARTDKIYLIEFEKGPLGGAPEDELSEITGTNQYIRTQTIKDKIRFTAQFGKQTGPFIIRGGIKDSTFGAGVDALLLGGRLRFSTDVFGGFTRTPRLKVAAAFAVFRSIYLLAGVDDALSDPGYLNINKGNTDVPTQFDEVRYGRDYFLGASLHFDDVDLSTMLRVYGALLVGALVR